MINTAGEPFELDNCTLIPCCRQEYADCYFEAGLVDGHQPDTIYVQLSREGEEPTTIFLRPDEAQALAWVINGALWSEAQNE